MKKFIQHNLDTISVFILFVLSRLPLLGHDMFNTDVWKWKARSYDFGSGIFYLDFAKTLQKYHPGVTLMWLNTIAIKFFNLYYQIFYGFSPPDDAIQTVFSLHFAQKLLIVLTLGLVVALIYYALNKLFGRLYALIAILFLLLEPFYIALTRVIHLEGLMSTFMLASFVWLVFYLTDETKRRRLYLSAVLASLAVLTKTAAIIIIPFMGAVLFLHFAAHRKNAEPALRYALHHALRPFFVWFGIAVFTFVLLWPAFYVIPVEVLTTLYRGIFTIGVERGHEQLYFGKYVLDPGPTFYPTVFLYMTSPFLIPGLIGFFAVVFKKLRTNQKYFVYYLLFFSVLILFELTIPTKKLTRYLLPAILNLALVSSFFYVWLLEKYKQKARIILSLCVVLWVGYLVKIHPDYLSYHSVYGGGLKTGIKVLEPKWIIGHHELMASLIQLKQEENLVDFASGESLLNSETLDRHLVVAFPEKYYTQVWPFIKNIGGWAVIEDLTGEAQLANYFVYPTWDDYSDTDTRFRLTFVKTVYLRNVPVFNIYERNN